MQQNFISYYYRVGDKSILFIYSDGGPDHRLTYISVQLFLIALVINLNY